MNPLARLKLQLIVTAETHRQDKGDIAELAGNVLMT
jgi:hypothetical protein